MTIPQGMISIGKVRRCHRRTAAILLILGGRFEPSETPHPWWLWARTGWVQSDHGDPDQPPGGAPSETAAGRQWARSGEIFALVREKEIWRTVHSMMGPRLLSLIGLMVCRRGPVYFVSFSFKNSSRRSSLIRYSLPSRIAMSFLSAIRSLTVFVLSCRISATSSVV